MTRESVALPVWYYAGQFGYELVKSTMKTNPNKYLQWLLLLILTVLGIRYAIFHLNAPDMRFQSTELLQTDNRKKITAPPGVLFHAFTCVVSRFVLGWTTWHL